MTGKLRVGIVGGGIGGVALAGSLLQRGFEVRVFERAPAFGEIGAGIQMTPNAVKVMKALGLLEKLQAAGFLPRALVGRNWRTARENFRTPLIDTCPVLYDAPFIHIHRADLHAILASLVPESVATFGVSCTGIRQEKNSAVALFDDGSAYEADLIVGADGVRSAVRSALFGAEAPRFTGHMCYRAVVPVDGVVDFVSPDASFWFGPKSHVVTYYVRGGKAVNIVAVAETSAWVEESWNAPSTKEEMLGAFQGWHRNVETLFQRVDQVFKWGLFDRDPMTTWSQGRVTLLGDAAHPMLPFLSQGAAMAIEDAYVLAAALDGHGSDVPSALRDYEAERLPRTSRVQLEARERGRTYHLPSPLAQAKRDFIYWLRGLINPQATGIQANWVYAYDARAFRPGVPSQPRLVA
ncbi:FAD-dependent monooxygenase [Arenibaculum pallidiluteum]|uniref:FAD-dependent monooxygenase n=1 Tax=Arenibaculum pallidiluteum TaxID=2812559 RepID=UPI001F43BFB8|nr:FAD-dependent monooxygenase [Arenibaculum pallidiluteum]